MKILQHFINSDICIKSCEVFNLQYIGVCIRLCMGAAKRKIQSHTVNMIIRYLMCTKHVFALALSLCLFQFWVILMEWDDVKRNQQKQINWDQRIHVHFEWINETNDLHTKQYKTNRNERLNTDSYFRKWDSSFVLFYFILFLFNFTSFRCDEQTVWLMLTFLCQLPFKQFSFILFSRYVFFLHCSNSTEID